MNVLIPVQQQDFISQYGEKTVEHVLDLPEENLTWVVYNEDMIGFAEMMIISLRGLEYFDKYVKVVSRDDSTGAKGKLYFDPKLFELIGNGYD
jgi:DNA-binding LacI/PurR family transcriptional regulator